MFKTKITPNPGYLLRTLLSGHTNTLKQEIKKINALLGLYVNPKIPVPREGEALGEKIYEIKLINFYIIVLNKNRRNY